ncbi:cytochrome b [Aureimonas leprariae]|uniref:Cytochrome b n=1 Tax=Plantimonas leprariae TaxID=2615207 RepID=A0A7V7PMW1_9HYPH|nr:cytochrome b [Aureimonas leprariae]KAB0678801.1 cytochrome b [Aureimonas leprariae]
MTETRSLQDGSDGVARLPLGTRIFHWTTVALLALMFGLILAAEQAGPGDLGATLVDLHRSVGLTLFLVVLARLAWRLAHPLPPLRRPAWERLLAGGVQAALYVCVLAMPALGWAASETAGDTIRLYGIVSLPSVLPMDEDLSDRLFQLHGSVAIALLCLIGLHAAGALRHRFVLRDGVFERMWLGGERSRKVNQSRR